MIASRVPATMRSSSESLSWLCVGLMTNSPSMRPTRTAVEFGVLALSGSYAQMPPSYSAKKVDGRRAYALARREQPVELNAVPVTVSRAVLTAFDDDTASVSITCSAGFYVRSFAHELGRMLGCGACLDALRRTRSGHFALETAVPLATNVGSTFCSKLRKLASSTLSGICTASKLNPCRLATSSV